MGLIKRILRLLGLGARPAPTAGPAPAAPDTSHSVTIQIRIDSGEWASNDALQRLYELANQVGQALQNADVGYLDGEIVGDKSFDILTCGSDADRMWDAIAPLLEPHPFARGSHALKMFGDPGPGTREERIDLHWDG